jgi:hypothetical protein
LTFDVLVSQPDRFQTDSESLTLKKLPTFRNDQAADLVCAPNVFKYAGAMRVGIMGIEAGISSSRLWVGERQWKTIEPIDQRAITVVNGIECELGLQHRSYSLPENVSEDQLSLLLSICSVSLIQGYGLVHLFMTNPPKHFRLRPWRGPLLVCRVLEQDRISVAKSGLNLTRDPKRVGCCIFEA